MEGIKNQRIALIDGDELVYRTGFASQHTHYEVYEDEEASDWVARFPDKEKAIEWINGQEGMIIKQFIEVDEVDEAYDKLNALFRTIMKDTGSDKYRIFLTGDNNFRFQLATIRPYKDRPLSFRPAHYMNLKAILLEEYNAEVIDNMEADDALSIAQYDSFRETGDWTRVNTIICTQDKDLNMVPGPRYSARDRKIRFISPKEARHSFFCQLLSGDKTDSVPGIYRVGLATADKIFTKAKAKTEERYYNIALDMYCKALKNPKCKAKLPTSKSGKEVIEEIGNLLWMKRSIDDVWTPDVKFI